MLYYERVARNAITGADAFMPIQLRLSESKNHFLCMHAHIASMVSSRHYRKRVFAVCLFVCRVQHFEHMANNVPTKKHTAKNRHMANTPFTVCQIYDTRQS